MKWLVVALAGVFAAGSAMAEDPAPKEREPSTGGTADAQAEERRKLTEQIARELGVAATPAAPATGAQPEAQTGGSPYARVLLLPDISAIGRGAMAWNQLDTSTLSPRSDLMVPAKKLEPVFQELEVALQAVVDPYARADVFLTFAPEGAAVEEAYLTSLALPAGFQAKAGTFYAPFGRLNQQHPHVWDFVDMPLAQARLVAADGLKGPGVDVAWLAPLPWFAELHLAYQKTTPAFEPDGRRTGLARLSQYFDLAEGVTLGVGLSAARLDEPAPSLAGASGGGWRDLYGGDLFLKVRPPEGRAYLAVQGELYARRLSGNADPALDGTQLGGYAQALLRPSAFWAVGARWEAAPAEGPGLSGPEHRWTALGSWYLTEFQRLRLQTSYDQLPGGRTGWEALLAVDFAIGVHGAHPF